jgi:ABC-type branched-subunit amino acid transport system ATPase component
MSEGLMALAAANSTGGGRILLVEQHAQVALGLAGRAYVIGRARVETAGTTEELRNRWSEIEASYLSLQA